MVVESPTHPHFFQPLLPNFHSHLSIPLKFFKLHLQGRNEINTVELRSDACERTWKVKMEGRTLTFGWKEFAVAHDFRVGDVVIFRHQGGLVFHVTGFGPSFCEILYVHSSNNEDAELDDDEEEKRSNLSMKQPVKTQPKSSQDEDNIGQRVSSYPFVKLSATPASLKRGRLYLPKSFTKVHKLENEGGKKIALLDKHGVEWPVNLVMDKRYTTMSLTLGLREFFKANDFQAYESFVLELVWKDIKTPMLKFCSTIKTSNSHHKP